LSIEISGCDVFLEKIAINGKVSEREHLIREDGQ